MALDTFDRPLGNSGLQVPPIGLGTWAIGGFLWGGTEEKKSEEAILASVQSGVTLIDTAPIYGFGLAEEFIGKTLKEHALRQQVFLASKCGLEWSKDKRIIRRNSAPEQIRFEIEHSLKRLQTDVMDLYQIHWPDSKVPFADSLQMLDDLKREGKIRAYGVSNFSAQQLQDCIDAKAPQLASNQPPYNIFEREAEKEILPFCHEHKIGTLTYGALCRGLLSGRITKETEFPVGDIRRIDPKFKPDKRPQYLKAVERLKKIAEKKNCTVGQLAIAWTFQQPGVTCALVGARNAKQAESNAGALSVELNQNDFDEVDRILKIEIKTPVGPDFFAPPS
jgi:aryl-alcohol dehydrogenase-like predicted oxidoreductase